MKKLLSILLLFCAVSAQAQFRLMPQGVVCAADPAQESVAYSFEGASAHSIYSATVKAANQMCSELTDAHISTIANKTVILEGIAPDCITLEGAGKGAKYSIYYRLHITISDGVLALKAPQILRIYGAESVLYLCGGSLDLQRGDLAIFSEKGKLRRAGAKASIEHYFNGRLKELVDQVQVEL